MVDFTQVMTGTVELDSSAVEEFDAQFILAQTSMGVADQFASYKKDIGAKSIALNKYDQMPLNTTPLNEREDVDSTPMADSEVIFTPQEFGDVITTTSLSNLQTGGKTNVAAARIVGINAGRVHNKLALQAMDASTRVLLAGDATSVAGDMDLADEVDALLLEKAYSALADKSSIGMPQANGEYVCIMHDNQIASLRSGTAAGSWQDVHKYAMPSEILRNEVGMFKGFRIIRDNLSTISIGEAFDGSDVYNSYFMGFNAFGKVESQSRTQVISGPFDKLQRFLNIGWKSTTKYGIVEQDALVIARGVKSPNAGLV